MDWKQILAEFLATLVARVAPALIELIVKWLESFTDADRIALVNDVTEAMKSKVA